MQIPKEFTGLGMPVFTAFGWAGEETAQKYALSQLEAFITIVHANLSRNLRDELPYYGLNEETQSVYLAASENVEDDLHIIFNARPLNLELQLALTSKEKLSKGLKQIEKDQEGFRQLLVALSPDWIFRVQQVHFNEETGDQGYYQDLYKESVAALEPEVAIDVFGKAIYLIADDKWITPIYLSQRIPTEQVAAMQQQIIQVMVDRLEMLAPIILVLKGQSAKKIVKAAKGKKATQGPALKPAVTTKPTPKLQKPPTTDEFTYVTALKPLHLRRGFINMESAHWPFFALNARTESRPVTIITSTMRDENCSVWRLQPNDQARLVLTPKSHRWLEDNFGPDDLIQLKVTKVDDETIDIVLEIPK